MLQQINSGSSTNTLCVALNLLLFGERVSSLHLEGWSECCFKQKKRPACILPRQQSAGISTDFDEPWINDGTAWMEY
jgi:hypothetical protein